jgi:ribosome-binding factor A
MSGRRTERLGEELRELVAEIVARLKDPRIGFVTVTRVELMPDLSHAKVYVGVLGDATQREQALTGLRSAAGFVRREVGHRLRIRKNPEIEFIYDRGLDHAARVAQLLEETKPEPAPAPEPEAPPEEGTPEE